MSVATRQGGAAATLPQGGRAAMGTARWYLARCHEGRELATCSAVRRLVPAGLLRDCFAPRVVRGAHGGEVPLFKGYLIVVTADAPALAKVLDSLSVPAEMVGQVGRGYAPVEREVQEFLDVAMDRDHVIRTSYATVDRGGLHVTAGPLVGQERRMGSLDPKSHHVRVTIGGATPGGMAQGAEPVGGAAVDGAHLAIDMPIELRIAPEAPREAADGPIAPRRAGTSLPLGRRTPRGRLRWYLVECPEGDETSACEAVRAAVSPSVLADAYVPMTERIKKVHGEWTKPVTALMPGCFVVATEDSAALKVELERTGLALRLAGWDTSFQPLDDEAWGFVQSFMDGSRTIRESTGEIVGDQLHVWSGPLAGRESVVKRFIRRQALAFVDLGRDRAGEHTLLMPLAIVARR